MALTVFYPDTPDLPLPDGHRFPAQKYRLLRDALLARGIIRPEELEASPEATALELLSVHTAEYVASIADGTVSEQIQKSIGLPWSPVLARRSRMTVGGTLAAARHALSSPAGWSGQLAGGTHHAYSGHGAGFCTFNDVAVTSAVLLAEDAVDRVAILDCDVHQGDGTAALLAPRADVFTVSIHGANNYPFEKQRSDLDIALGDGAGDKAYEHALVDALEAVAAFQPDLMLYISGADILAKDRLGRLALTHEGLAARDALVFQFARRRGLPVAIAIGGGYARPIDATVEGYVQTFRTAVDVLGR
ncbi:MAG: histone deacetylase [Pseudomonadota bacterium]